MKKIFSLSLSLVAALMLAMWSSQAGAITLGQYDTGALVPVVVGNNSNADTVVGITTTGGQGWVCWAFFDQNSNHVADSCFPMTNNDYYAFSWNQELKKTGAVVAPGTMGYLVFALSNQTGSTFPTTAGLVGTGSPATTGSIAANAFQVDTSAHDAVYIPVIPLSEKYGDFVGGVDLRHMDGYSVQTLTNGITPGATVDVPYWIDPAYNATTAIMIWSVCDMRNVGPNGQTILVFNEDEVSTSVQVSFPKAELNLIDPKTFTTWPGGFIRLALPSTNTTCDTTNHPNEANWTIVFSYIDSSLISAAQTEIASEVKAAQPEIASEVK
jgi:hypothetical protein